MRKIFYFGIFALLFGACTGPQRSIDFSKGNDQLDAYLKIRLSQKEGEVVVYYCSGTVYAHIQEQRTQALFDFEGYNIAQAVKSDSGYYQLAKEVVFYKDLHTGQILEHWYSPFLKDTLEVFHIWNDPANVNLKRSSFEKKRMGIKFTPLAHGNMSMFVDIWLNYPSPLPKKDYPAYSRSDMYQAGELFNFFFQEKDLQNPRLASIPVQFSWTRISDFLPWMRMADRPGHIVYSARGSKLAGGFDALPPLVKAYVLQNQPAFAAPPAAFSSPNMSSWKYFKKIIDEREGN